MANSYIEYTSGLTGTTFSVPFKYISIDDIQALGFDGEKYVPLTISSRSGSDKTITLSAAPSTLYTKLRLYRSTSIAQLVDFQNGSRLSERDLDTAYQQGLFTAQEISEDASTAQFAAVREVTIAAGTSLSNFASEAFIGDGTSTVFDITVFNTQTIVSEAYRVSIDGVMQSPIDAYSISMHPSQITFTSAPPSGSKIVVVTAASAASAAHVDDVTIGLTSANQVIVKDGGITSTKLATDAVTEDKIENGAVTAAKLSTGSPSWNSTEMVLTGGGDGANIELYGASHPSNANSIYHDADTHVFRSTGQTERMRIDSDGNLLIGTTDISPYNNTGSNTGIVLRSDNIISSARANGQPLLLNRLGSNGGIVGFFREGTQVGIINVDGSSTTYATTSDYRLKEDIIEIDGSIDRLKALKPCNFRWKVDGTRVDGFIAHEAQEVVPEAVTGTKDAVDEEGNPDYQGIDQSKLVPLLTKALQEAVAKIEALETRVEALENA